MNYFPAHCHSWYSLLDGLSSPQNIAKRVVKTGLPGCALTDHGNISGAVSFLKAMKSACKNCGNTPQSHKDNKGRCLIKGETCQAYEPAKLKGVLGTEFYVCDGEPTIRTAENKRLHHQVVLARTQAGWKNLIKATSCANQPDHFYYKPRLNVDLLAGFASGEWITFSGHPGSALADAVFADPKQAYRAKSYEEAKSFAKDWNTLKVELPALACRYRDLFGADNFFLEIQLIDGRNCPAAEVVAKALRWVSKETGIPCLATPDAHYPTQADAPDQRVLLCSAAGVTLQQAAARLEMGEDVMLGGFFKSNRYHIPDAGEMEAIHTPEELRATLDIFERCEPINLTGPTQFPAFQCPNGISSHEYLKELCGQGWERKIKQRVPAERLEEYRTRLAMELDVLGRAGLAPYFLVVWDMHEHAVKQLKCPPGEARGSAFGCLVSYLIGLTCGDPVKAKLTFERFYNEGRNSPGSIALPDIDMDFPVTKRESIIEYLRNRWGRDRVSQIATFGTLQGREALKQVLRAHGWGSSLERDDLSSRLPDKAAISDKLQEQIEEEGTSSIIIWALKNHPEDFADVCKYTDEGDFEGPLGSYFAQASRIEGCKRTRGKHASGVVIAPEPLGELCPMLYDEKTNMGIAGMEFTDLESMGLVKLDILGVGCLDKIAATLASIRGEDERGCSVDESLVV